MTARQATYELMHRLASRNITLSFDEANTLRRAELTLHRWAELECGDSGPFASWSIERDEETQLPYWCVYPHDRPSYRRRIADREMGAIRRVAAICAAHGLHFYHQTDPRGCALYVSNERLQDNDYSRGVACCA